MSTKEAFLKKNGGRKIGRETTTNFAAKRSERGGVGDILSEIFEHSRPSRQNNVAVKSFPCVDGAAADHFCTDGRGGGGDKGGTKQSRVDEWLVLCIALAFVFFCRKNYFSLVLTAKAEGGRWAIPSTRSGSGVVCSKEKTSGWKNSSGPRNCSGPTSTSHDCFVLGTVCVCVGFM